MPLKTVVVVDGYFYAFEKSVLELLSYGVVVLSDGTPTATRVGAKWASPSSRLSSWHTVRPASQHSPSSGASSFEVLWDWVTRRLESTGVTSGGTLTRKPTTRSSLDSLDLSL